MSKIRFYVGSYAEQDENSIHCYDMDANTMEVEKISEINGIDNPSYICVDEKLNKLYAALENFEFKGETGGGVASFDLKDGQMTQKSAENVKGTLPCHILKHDEGGYIFTANYWSGSATMYALDMENNATIFCDMAQHEGVGQNAERQEGPHAHFCGFSPAKDGLWVVDLGIDAVKYYDIDMKNHKLVGNEKKDVHLPKGVGPRHFVWNQKQEHVLYVICELTSEIYVVDTKKNVVIQSISTLGDGVKNSACSAIRISEDGKFIYAGNRGDDSIALFKVLDSGMIELVEITSVEGENPRDLNLKGNYLFVANQDSNKVYIFTRHAESGKLEFTNKTIEITKPSCIEFV